MAAQINMNKSVLHTNICKQILVSLCILHIFNLWKLSSVKAAVTAFVTVSFIHSHWIQASLTHLHTSRLCGLKYHYYYYYYCWKWSKSQAQLWLRSIIVRHVLTARFSSKNISKCKEHFLKFRQLQKHFGLGHRVGYYSFLLSLEKCLYL